SSCLPSPPAISSRPLPDALPICTVVVNHPALAFRGGGQQHFLNNLRQSRRLGFHRTGQRVATQGTETHHLHFRCLARLQRHTVRSEEHTSELQSRENLVCRLLLE